MTLWAIASRRAQSLGGIASHQYQRSNILTAFTAGGGRQMSSVADRDNILPVSLHQNYLLEIAIIIIVHNCLREEYRSFREDGNSLNEFSRINFLLMM